MVLSDKEILKIQGGSAPLITPFDDSKLRAASYDVSLDGEITALLERADVLDLSNQDAVDLIYSTKRGLGEFILKPGQYCLAALNEVIALPDNVVARVMPRTRFTRLGLLVTPQFCNPSYSGRLQIGILNVSGNNIKLAPKMGIAQLVFERLESTPTEGRLYRNQPSAAYQDEDGFIGAQTKSEMSDGARRIYDRMMANLRTES
jgi:dCTP deaminase